MQKMVIILFSLMNLFFQLNCYASASAPANLTSAITTAIAQTSKINSIDHSTHDLAIIYGGQDFSHPQIATAQERTWSIGQPIVAG